MKRLPLSATTAPPPALVDDRSRPGLVQETWFVELAFLVPAVVVAIGAFAAHLGGDGTISRFPVIIHGNPLANLILGIASYLSVGAVVPLALLLLARTGQGPAALGLTTPHWRDLLPGIGIAAANFVTVVVLSRLVAVLAAHHQWLFAQPSTGHVPAYYIVFALAVSAVTAVTEETIVNGYLLTRLEQLGWAPGRALALSMALRASYHVYYGLGFLLTIPFGYYAGRSFQKHHRLTRPILAHFVYDATILTITVLTAQHS